MKISESRHSAGKCYGDGHAKIFTAYTADTNPQIIFAGLGLLSHWINGIGHGNLELSLIAGLLALLIVAPEWFDSRRKKRFIESRAGEGICQFARSFDRRKTDTRIVRAVYEELAQALGVRKAVFPVRAADAIFSKQGLHFDSEELDLIAQDIAFRAGRSLVNVEQNPYFGRIETVADLVAFFMAQPEISLA